MKSVSLPFSSALGCHPAEWGAPWGQWGVSCLVPLMVAVAFPCGQAWDPQAWTPLGNGFFIISTTNSNKRHWEASDEGKRGDGTKCRGWYCQCLDLTAI